MKFKFRSKLTAVFVGTAVLPLAAAMGLMLVQMRSGYIENAVSAQQRIANSAAQEFSDFIGRQFITLGEVARIQSTQALSQESKENLTDLVLFSNKAFVEIVVTDVAGQEILRKHRLRVIQPEEFGSRSNDEAFLNVKEARAYIGPILVDGGKPQFVVGRSVLDSFQNFRGAVIATIDAGAMQRVVDSLYAVGEGGRAYAVDKKGTVVAHPDFSNVLAERDFSLVPIVAHIRDGGNGFDFRKSYKNELGQSVLGSFSSVKLSLEGIAPIPFDTQWFIIAEQSSTVALASVNNMIFVAFGVLLLASVLTATSALFIAKNIVNPVEILHRTMLKFGRGEFKSRVKIKTGDEIEDLAHSFNSMAEDLERYHADLEEAKTTLEIKVEARTHELKELTDRQEEIIKQRTKEIKERMEELERFHRLAVGRELKMIELKEEIKKLKNAGTSRS